MGKNTITVVDVGEQNLEHLIKILHSMAQSIQASEHLDLRPNDLSIFQIAVKEYMQLDLDHPLCRKHPDPFIVVEAYRVLEKYLKTK